LGFVNIFPNTEAYIDIHSLLTVSDDKRETQLTRGCFGAMTELELSLHKFFTAITRTKGNRLQMVYAPNHSCAISTIPALCFWQSLRTQIFQNSLFPPYSG